MIEWTQNQQQNMIHDHAEQVAEDHLQEHAFDMAEHVIGENIVRINVGQKMGNPEFDI